MKLLPARLPAADLTSLSDHLGRRARPLAWAASDDGVVVALDDRLCVRDADGWSDVPWHDVLRGGWDGADGVLRWVRMSTGDRREAHLAEPRSMPEVFRERVEATILVRHVVRPRPGKAITITARRPLGDGDGRILWTAHPAPGVRMDAETLAFTEAELARLRAEYAF